MTNVNHPPTPADEPAEDVDATFAALAASMPELAAISGPEPALVDVVVVIPDPTGRGPAARVTIGVPAAFAPAVQREFAPDRIAAMMNAVNAIVAETPSDE